jgi:four helix bundle protein
MILCIFRIANGSTFELITQLILAKRLKLINEDTIQPIINQSRRSNMNFALQKSLKTNNYNDWKILIHNTQS